MEREILERVRAVPGVKSVVSAVGRGESPADPQSQNENSAVVSLVSRDAWPEGWTQDDIANAIRAMLLDLPGVSVVMGQPIAQRVAELVTGVRSDVAVKVFGDDMETLLDNANRIARIVAATPGARDLRVEKVSGQQYLNIEIDRAAIARYGLNVADINQLVETALGGKLATQVFEGQRRFDATVRLPEAYRDDPNAIGDILVNTPGGALVQLGSVARIEVREGPAQISREMAKRRVVVGVNVSGRDLGGFVAELQQKVDKQVAMPAGYYLEWGGQFQNMQRALGHLAVIVPVTIAAIFFLLFLLFGSVRYAVLIITVLPFASIGGVIGLALSGEYLSVPASVGFIALCGIAVLNGVVLVSYIRSLRHDGMSVEQAVLEGAKLRFRPVMMTATVALLGLLPFLFATGPGSEVQRPLAAVVIGGLISSTLLTLVVVPAIYRWFDEPDHRQG
jgi:cobalt-zinc-cadmium resistance protein CzcA